MQKSNSGFYMAVAVIISLASLFYSWKYILPSYQKSQGEIAGVDAEISAAKTKLDSLQITKNNIDQLGDIVNKLFIAVPEDKDVPNLITELEAVAAKSKMALPSVQITDGGASAASAVVAGADSPSVAVGLNPISVSLSVSGPFTDLNAFIANIEKDVRFTSIKSISLASGKDDDLTLSLQLEVYKRSASTVPADATNTNTTAGGQ